MRKNAILPCILLATFYFWACTGTGATRTNITDTGLQDTGDTEVAVYPQLGHSDLVNSVTFSPDGKLVLSGSSDNTLKLWDAATGREIRTFLGHSDIVNSVAFSPDGMQVVSGSNDKTLKLWDVATGHEIRTYSGHTDTVLSVEFSPDGRRLLSGSQDRTAKLWDVRTGREIRTIQNWGPVISVVFSPDGKQVIVSNAYSFDTYQASIGKWIRGFDKESGSTNALAFSPDGRQIISGSDVWTTEKNISGDSIGAHNYNLLLCDARTGREIKTFSRYNHNSEVKSAVFSPDGKIILSGYNDGSLTLWDIATGQEIRSFTAQNFPIFSVSFSPDGKQVISNSVNNIKSWDAATGREIKTFSGQISAVHSVTVSPDRGQVLSGSGDNTIQLWDAATGQVIRTFQGHTNAVNSLAVSPDGSQVLSGADDKTLKFWDAATGQEIRTFEGHDNPVYSVAFNPDGKQLLSGSRGFFPIKLWDTDSGQEIRTFQGNNAYISFVAFSPDGKQVFSSSRNDILSWDAATGQEIKTFSGHSLSVESLAFSPDGRQLLSGSRDNTIRLWDVATGREVRTFSGHTDSISSIAFSPDGRHIISSSPDKTIKLWDTNSGQVIKTFSESTAFATSVAFDPNGKIIISGYTDGTTRLWETESGNEIAQFISFNDGEWIAITSEGYYNSSPSGDQHLNVRIGNSVFGIDQYRQTFYNPALVALALSDRNAYMAAMQQTIQDTAAPPSIVITSPSAIASAASTSISVSVDGGSQSIQYLTVNVNGRIIARDIGVTPPGTKGLAPIARLAVLAAGDANKKQVSFNLDIPLDPGSNIIEVLAFNGFSEGRALVEVSYNTTQSNLPNLYILSIGVGRYADPSVPNLRFAPNDAKGIVSAFKTQEGRRYGQVRSLVLADGADREPTRDNISDGMDFLRGARPSDIIMLFLSGHGGTDDLGQFFFMPGNMAFNQNGTPQRSRIIPNNELQEVLRFPGQKLVFIDSCYSGGFTGNQAGTVDNDTLINSLKDDAPVIFTSSSKTQQSWEWESASLGLFTHVLIQGLSGTADVNRDGRITVEELGDYVKKTVPGMKDSQQPYYWSPPGYRDFVIAVTGR